MFGGGSSSVEYPQSLIDAWGKVHRRALGPRSPLVEDWLAEAIGNNPYDHHMSLFDPTTDLANALGAITEFRSALAGTLHPVTWEAKTASAHNAAYSYFPTQDLSVFIDALVSNAVTASSAAAAEAVGKARGDASTLATAAGLQGRAEASVALQAADTLIGTMTSAQMTTTDALASSIAAARQAVFTEDARDSAADATDRAHTESQTAAVIATSISSMMTEAGNVLGAAVTAAGNVITDATLSTVLNDIVTEYENRARLAYMRAVNRFTGGMADINAVMSSAFGMGMANLEAEFLADIRKYQAELEHRVFDKGMDLYHDVFNRAFAVYMQTYMQELMAYLEAYTRDLGYEVQLFLSTFAQHFGLFMGLLPAYTQMHGDTERGYEALAGGIYSNSIKSFATSLDEYVKSLLSMRLQTQQSRDEYLFRAPAMLTEMSKAYVAAKGDAMRAYGDYAKLATVAQTEAELAEAEMGAKQVRWKMDMAQLGANIVAAPSGAAGIVQSAPSRGQGALAGIALGAGVAAQAGASFAPAAGAGVLAGPPGLLLGAGIGGLMSLFGD